MGGIRAHNVSGDTALIAWVVVNPSTYDHDHGHERPPKYMEI